MKSKLSRLAAGAALAVLTALLWLPAGGCTLTTAADTGALDSSTGADGGGGDLGPADTGTGDYTSDGEGGGSGDSGSGAEPSAEPPTGEDTGDTGVDTGVDTGTGTDDTGGTQSGTLTAGSFDDNLNFDVFQDFMGEVLQSDAAGDYPSLALGQRVIVTVKDGQDAPILDARVVITPEGQEEPVLLDQTTGSDGRVLFLTGLDDTSDATSFTLTVYPPGEGEPEPVADVRTLDDLEWNVTLATTAAAAAKLDLAFVVDATGSMADELEYLKTEVQSIAQAVSELFPDVTQRYALIVYRDEGDIYVVRPFDFTATLQEFVDNLAAQSADGGADWPEAVHLALEESGKLSWETSGTARVLFWIADAPPHTEFAERTFEALQALRAKTIAVYPVAASGVGTELEFYMRTAAFLTLSEYLFLTNDSGVGNPHAEPHIPCYHVQRLDQLMIRMIQSELAGQRSEPNPADIIRTVGNPVNGVCTPEEDETGQQQEGQVNQ